MRQRLKSDTVREATRGFANSGVVSHAVTAPAPAPSSQGAGLLFSLQITALSTNLAKASSQIPDEFVSVVLDLRKRKFSPITVVAQKDLRKIFAAIVRYSKDKETAKQWVKEEGSELIRREILMANFYDTSVGEILVINLMNDCYLVAYRSPLSRAEENLKILREAALSMRFGLFWREDEECYDYTFDSLLVARKDLPRIPPEFRIEDFCLLNSVNERSPPCSLQPNTKPFVERFVRLWFTPSTPRTARAPTRAPASAGAG